jgi:hypothetical protein
MDEGVSPNKSKICWVCAGKERAESKGRARTDKKAKSGLDFLAEISDSLDVDGARHEGGVLSHLEGNRKAGKARGGADTKDRPKVRSNCTGAKKRETELTFVLLPTIPYCAQVPKYPFANVQMGCNTRVC